MKTRIKASLSAVAMAATLLIAQASAAHEERPDGARPESGWLARMQTRVGRALERLEAKLSGRSSDAAGCGANMAGGGMMRGAMMNGGNMGAEAPNQRWRAPDRSR